MKAMTKNKATPNAGICVACGKPHDGALVHLTHLPLGMAMGLDKIVRHEIDAGRAVILDDSKRIVLDHVPPTYHRTLLRMAKWCDSIVRDDDIDPFAWSIYGPEDPEDT